MLLFFEIVAYNYFYRALNKYRMLLEVLYRKTIMNGCFTCLNCGKVNPVKGNSYTNKYCNNSCQQQHRSRQLVTEWKEKPEQTAWRQVPEWVKKYLIQSRGHQCEICNNTKHAGNDIPLVVDYKDNNSHNSAEDNLELICPNCKSQKH